MININAEPKPSYELTEEELDKATGGREGPRAPDQPDRDHQGCGQPIAQTVGARRTSDVAFFLPRDCWASGFSFELGCDSSLGWTDSF